MKAFALFLLAAVLCVSCTSVTSRTAPGIDLGKYQRVFVLQPFNENHHVDELMVNELRRLGKTATSGPLTMMPEEAEIIVSYDARWTWDFTTYLIDLNAEVHTAHTKKKLAEARYFQPNARPKSAEIVAPALIDQLFRK